MEYALFGLGRDADVKRAYLKHRALELTQQLAKWLKAQQRLQVASVVTL